MSEYLEGKIAAILDDKTVVINKGSSNGVVKNDKFYIYSEIGPFVDPESGEELGAHKKILGSVVVDTVEDKFCIASTPTKVVISDFSGIAQDIFMPKKRERRSLPIDESQKHEPSGSFKVEIGTPVFRTESADESESNGEAENRTSEQNGSESNG